MDDPVEIELKLEYDPADRDRILASPLLGASGARRQRLAATYFDTPDRRLDKDGFALRIRGGGKRRVQTVKASGTRSAGLFVRGEWEVAIDAGEPIIDKRAGPLYGLYDADVLGRIAPVFSTRIERVAGLVEHSGARIEYAVDIGRLRMGRHGAAISEIEFELKSGTPQALFDIARLLHEEVPLRLGVLAKSERGYAMVAGTLSTASKAEAIRLGAGATAGEAFAIIAASCLRHYRLNESILLQHGTVEAVHQARVALRRLRSALALFRPLFAGDRRAALLGEELRWLAGELGRIRDIDVLVPRLEGSARATLIAARDQLHAHVTALLQSSRVRLIPLDLAEWLMIGAWRCDPADDTQRDRGVLQFSAERLDRLRKRIKRDGQDLASLDDEQRHGVRKDAKKLRYASETFASLYTGRKARRRLDRFLDRLGALQDKLGELNDIAAASEILSRFGLDAALPGRSAKRQRRLLDKAEDCFEALIDSKRFWRV